MGKATIIDIEHASLMTHNQGATFLYTPPTFKAFHITDLCKEGQSMTDGFTALDRILTLDEPKASIWKIRSSESEDGKHVRLFGRLSAVVAAAATAQEASKRKNSALGKAGFLTSSWVKREKILATFGKPVGKWVSGNAKALLVSDFPTDIERDGIWFIRSACFRIVRSHASFVFLAIGPLKESNTKTHLRGSEEPFYGLDFEAEKKEEGRYGWS
ncbi:hypothetical protein PITC_059220 [Penicillium italicum]|uniref:Uncharacterized protein n=1 Tax=Penicillium italicum TaxID=40296 RepID=A0A0A2LEI1_PENIT|nr:hypothetical protein PITC_059220 [Penicillium italicum]